MNPGRDAARRRTGRSPRPAGRRPPARRPRDRRRARTTPAPCRQRPPWRTFRVAAAPGICTGPTRIEPLAAGTRRHAQPAARGQRRRPARVRERAHLVAGERGRPSQGSACDASNASSRSDEQRAGAPPAPALGSAASMQASAVSGRSAPSSSCVRPMATASACVLSAAGEREVLARLAGEGGHQRRIGDADVDRVGDELGGRERGLAAGSVGDRRARLAVRGARPRRRERIAARRQPRVERGGHLLQRQRRVDRQVGIGGAQRPAQQRHRVGVAAPDQRRDDRAALLDRARRQRLAAGQRRGETAEVAPPRSRARAAARARGPRSDRRSPSRARAPAPPAARRTPAARTRMTAPATSRSR